MHPPRVALASIVVAVVTQVVGQAQAPIASPTFEVVSVGRSVPETGPTRTATLVVVLLAVAVVGPVLWATVYRRARPDRVDTSPAHLIGAAVTGRFPRLRRRPAAEKQPAEPTGSSKS